MATEIIYTERAAREPNSIAVRIYDPTPRYYQGGLHRAAEAVRRGGEWGDDILLHVNPDEFEELKRAWGEPTINDNTGLPEYGLKRLFKKAGNFVKRLAKNPIVGMVAPMAMNMLLPGVGGLIGQSLFGAASSKAKGGNALLGALTGAAGHVLGGGGVKGTGANASGTLQQGLEKLGNWGSGQSGMLGKVAKNVADRGSTLAAIARSPIGRGVTQFGMEQLRGAQANYDNSMREMEAQNQGETGVGGYGPDDGAFGERLRNLTFNRQRRSPTNYYRYGRDGGEEMFFEPNAIPDFQPTVAKADGGGVSGPGSGRDDAIEALLSDGEYVVDAESVALLGDGSVDEGARRLDQMRQNLRRHKGRNLAKGKFSHAAKNPEEYMSGGRTKKAKGGAITRVIKGGLPRGTEAERKAQLEAMRRFEAAYRSEARAKETPPVKKAKGGAISDKGAMAAMTKLANQLESSLRSGNSARVAQVSKILDGRYKGASDVGIKEFAKGGSVARALREWISPPSPPSRVMPAEDLPVVTKPGEAELDNIAEILRALNPESPVLQKYDFEKQRRKAKSVRDFVFEE